MSVRAQASGVIMDVSLLITQGINAGPARSSFVSTPVAVAGTAEPGGMSPQSRRKRVQTHFLGIPGRSADLSGWHAGAAQSSPGRDQCPPRVHAYTAPLHGPDFVREGT